MRKDMRYVVIDRPRHGGNSRWEYNDMVEKRVVQRIRNDPESLPKMGKMSMGRGSKSLSDHIRPLERFLHKQVGRPWDKVWSEISKVCPADGLMQQHIRGHVFDFVQLNVRIIDHVPHEHSRGGGYGWRPIASHWRKEMYVCPNSGILKECKQLPPLNAWNHVEPNPDRVTIDEWTQAHKINDCWFEVKLETYAPKKNIWIPTDAVLRNHSLNSKLGCYGKESELRKLYGRGGVYGVSKRQMSKKEIKEYITGDNKQRR